MTRPRLPIGAHGDFNVRVVDAGKWRARTLYRFPDGVVRQVERHGATKGKAQNTLLDALTKIEAAPSSHVTTVKTLAVEFLKIKTDAGLAPGTLEGYGLAINGHVAKRLGSMVVGEVTPMHVQSFITAVTADGGPGAAKTCKAVLSGMFKLAIRKNLIKVSPVAGLEPIKSSGARAAKALTVDQLNMLLGAVRDDEALTERDMPDLWEFMAYTGCRIAEALALRWGFTNTPPGTVTLGPVVTRSAGRGAFIHEAGKTDVWRTIVVPQQAIDLLKRREPDVPDGPLGLVFPDPFGGIRSTSSVEMLWRSARHRVGFPTFTSHGFRKTVATMLDAAGMSARDIAEYLGHENPSMTQDVYMSRTTQSKKMAEVLAAKVGVNSGSA